MKIGILFLTLCTVLSCAVKNQSSPENTSEIKAGDSSVIDYTKRNLNNFRKITREMTNNEVFDLVGTPDRDIGSGLFIFEYSLQDNSIVMVGTTGKNVLYVRHNGNELLAGAG